MALEYCRLKKAKTETRTKSKSKQWKDDQSNVFSFCLKYEKYCRKFWNPPCLTHWPTFVSRKFPQVQLLVGEFVDPIFRRVARAHQRAHGAPRLRPSPAPRWFLISQNHHRTVRLETPASAVDQIVSYCWTFWESKIFKEYSQILQTIQNIHWFQSFSHQRGSCRASSVSSHQLWQRVSFPLWFIYWNLLKHWLWIMIGLKHLWCVNGNIVFLSGFIYSERISTESFWQWQCHDNVKDEKTFQTKKFNG